MVSKIREVSSAIRASIDEGFFALTGMPGEAIDSLFADRALSTITFGDEVRVDWS